MNYFQTLCELDTLNNTVHLSEKGAAQINEFREYVTPLIPDIRKGDVAKASIAEFYLGKKSEYTDGVKKLLEPLVEQLGVSAGYISQVKKTKEFKESIANPSLKEWVDEHPVTVQYRLSKVPTEELTRKMMTGEHFSKREAEKFTQGKKEKEQLNPVSQETKTEYQLKQERFQQMAESDEYPLLRETSHAAVFCSGNRKAILAAAAQVLFTINWQDPELEKIVGIVHRLSGEALQKPHYVPASLGVSK